MDEIRNHINQLRKDCQAVILELSAAGKIHEDLEKEVGQLRASTRLLRKRAINMVEQVKKAGQRRRIREHLGDYIEALAHKRARIELSVQKIHQKNEGLLENRRRLTAEGLDLQDTILALPETEELDCVYYTSNDEQLTRSQTFGNKSWT
jgi:predicted  nucleic acid-binding Zn-ribbon protein